MDKISSFSEFHLKFQQKKQDRDQSLSTIWPTINDQNMRNWTS